MAKKKHEEHENHERWLVSYADFITLLFAFFVVMYSMSSVNEGKYRVLSESMVAAFKSSARTLQPVQVGELSRSPHIPDANIMDIPKPVNFTPIVINQPYPPNNDPIQVNEHSWGSDAGGLEIDGIAAEVNYALQELIDEVVSPPRDMDLRRFGKSTRARSHWSLNQSTHAVNVVPTDIPGRARARNEAPVLSQVRSRMRPPTS